MNGRSEGRGSEKCTINNRIEETSRNNRLIQNIKEEDYSAGLPFSVLLPESQWPSD